MKARAAAMGFMLAAIGAVPAWSQSSGPSIELTTGVAAYNKGDFVFAYRLLRAAADRGEAEAMVNLGYMYARGHGVPSDPAFALQLYRRAADAGDAEGMNAVGYRYNFAASPDYAKAIDWYCRAIARGNPRAMNNLGNLIYQGLGVPRDRQEARSLWSQATRRGNLNAQVNLGHDLMGDPVLSEAERQAGHGMVRDAARQGSAAAQRLLRSAGDTEAFPPAVNTELLMKLEPRDPVPGHARVCGEAVS